MTISSTPSEIPYAGDGVSTVFTIPFPFDTSADLKVVETDSSGTPAEVTSGFSISGGAGSGGSLTRSVALPVGTTLTILDDPTLTQDTDYTDNDAFPAETHERALDRGVRISKRLYDLIQNCVHVGDGDPSAGAGLVLPPLVTRKSKWLALDSSGNVTVIGASPPTQIAAVPTGIDTGAVNALVVSLPNFVLQQFAAVWFSVNITTTTTTPTLNVNGTGAKTLKQADGAALAAGQLVAGELVCAMYDGAAYRVISWTKLFGDISVANAAVAGTLTVAGVPYTDSGTFTGTLTGLTTSPTLTVTYRRTGNLVCITHGDQQGTSNSNALTVTGAPASIFPSALRQGIYVSVLDNSVVSQGTVAIQTDGELVLHPGVASGTFTSANTKGVRRCTFCYPI